MGIIKKIYHLLRNEYRACNLCCFSPHTKLIIDGYPPDCIIENGYETDMSGKIILECPACKGTGIIWDNKKWIY